MLDTAQLGCYPLSYWLWKGYVYNEQDLDRKKEGLIEKEAFLLMKDLISGTDHDSSVGLQPIIPTNWTNEAVLSYLH